MLILETLVKTLKSYGQNRELFWSKFVRIYDFGKKPKGTQDLKGFWSNLRGSQSKS